MRRRSPGTSGCAAAPAMQPDAASSCKRTGSHAGHARLVREPARDDVMMADMCDVVGVIRLLLRACLSGR